MLARREVARMGPFTFFALFVLVVATIAVVSFARHRSEWSAFAGAHQLELRGGYFWPRIEGRYRGHRARVRIVRRAMSNDEPATEVRVTIEAPMPPGFAVREEGLLHLLGKVAGVQDITVGDRELDDALVIQGDDMVGIIRLMNISEVGAAVLGMVTVHPTIQVAQTLVVAERGVADRVRLEAVLDGLVELARALEEGYARLKTEDGGVSPWSEGA